MNFTPTISQNKPEPDSGRAAPLGIYTNFSANLVALRPDDFTNPSYVVHDTGEIQNFELVPVFEKGKRSFEYRQKLEPAFFRSEKFALQRVAARLLRPLSTKKGRDFRVGQCFRSVVDPSKSVGIYKSIEHGKCHYGGVMQCGSVWVCPVCASKITERRSQLIEQAIESHKAAGGDVLLVTFTAPHTREQSLSDLLQGFKKAEEGFQKTRAIVDLKKTIGFIEPIKSLEITYGHSNGWHPHSHQLWFVKAGIDTKTLKNKLYPHWKRYCEKRGLEAPSLKHGIDVRNGLNAAQYVSKMGWSLGKEVAKGHTKKGRSGNFAPFDLLQEHRETRSDWSKARFQEYAQSTFGLQYISRFPKLQALYDLGKDLSDEEIAAAQEDQSVKLGELPLNMWRKVVFYDLVAAVLELAESSGFVAVLQLLESLPVPRGRSPSPPI